MENRTAIILGGAKGSAGGATRTGAACAQSHPTASAWSGFSPAAEFARPAQLLFRDDRLTLGEIRKCLPITNLDRAVLHHDDAGSSPFVKYLVDAFPRTADQFSEGAL